MNLSRHPCCTLKLQSTIKSIETGLGFSCETTQTCPLFQRRPTKIHRDWAKSFVRYYHANAHAANFSDDRSKSAETANTDRTMTFPSASYQSIWPFLCLPVQKRTSHFGLCSTPGLQSPLSHFHDLIDFRPSVSQPTIHPIWCIENGQSHAHQELLRSNIHGPLDGTAPVHLRTPMDETTLPHRHVFLEERCAPRERFASHEQHPSSAE